MSKKWSQKTEKTTLVNDDEFMILDSVDANGATKNKRVKASTIINNGANTFSFQTVGAATQQQVFNFTGAMSLNVLMTAANAGNTKGFAKQFQVNCTITNSGNTFSVAGANDFGTADISVTNTANSLTITMNGEAGETINWKGNYQVVKI